MEKTWCAEMEREAAWRCSAVACGRRPFGQQALVREQQTAVLFFFFTPQIHLDLPVKALALNLPNV